MAMTTATRDLDRLDLLRVARPRSSRRRRSSSSPSSSASSTARRRELLAARAERWQRLRAGELPDFLPETREIRDGDWRVPEAPPDLRDRRVEITGPVDRKMMINALNSGASVFMADFEDANSPTWENVVEGQAQPARRGRAHDLARHGREELRAERRRSRRSSSGRAAGTSSRSTRRSTARRSARASSTSGSTSSTTRDALLDSGQRPVLLPAEARDAPRGAALERRVHARGGAARPRPRRRSARPC